MDKIKLSDINIGLSDGEIEAEQENFENMFYTGNRKFEEMSNMNKYFVTGRKGTGKTILAKYYLLKKKFKTRKACSKISSFRSIQS